MSQSNKKKHDRQLAEKAPTSKAIDSDQKGKRRGYIIIVSVFVVIIVLIILFFNYQQSAPLRLTIITVDDTSIKMDYFIKRTRMAGNSPMNMLTVLTNEQIIRLVAPKYVGEVSPEDIDQVLREIARGESETISEIEFKEWYRQQLNESGFTDSEYREGITTGLLASGLQRFLAERMPTVVPQIHLYAILLETYDDAEEVRARWEAGEDFTDLAREVSLEEESGQQGGDVGWFANGVLSYVLSDALDYTAFSLDTGEVSDPLTYIIDLESNEVLFYLFMVSEKSDARELDEDSRQILQTQVLDIWLAEEIQYHEIGWHGLNNGFDSETSAWISLQLAK